MMQLTKNFKFEEFYASDTAKAKGINNIPTNEASVNIARLADHCMQKIRENFNQPVIITSGFRCSKLNTALGGALNSQHLCGQAADFYVKNYSLKQVFDWCCQNLVFDQLIDEKGQWIHISYNSFKNRKERLRYDGKNYIKI